MFEIELCLGRSLDHNGAKLFLKNFFRYLHIWAPMAFNMFALRVMEVCPLHGTLMIYLHN